MLVLKGTLLPVCVSSTSTVFPSAGSGLSPLLTWPSCTAESTEWLLYDINSMLALFPLNMGMPLSNWLPTSSFLLLPGQDGQGTVLTVSWRDDLLSSSLDEQGALTVLQTVSISAFQLPMLPRCPLSEGGTRGGLLQEGIGSDPREWQVWPFDPWPLHHRDQLFTIALPGLTPIEHPLSA